MSTENETSTTPEQDEAAAEQAMNEAFGAEAKPEVTEPKPEAKAETPAAEKSETPTQTPEWQGAIDKIKEDVTKQLSRLDGRYGEVNRSINEIREALKAGGSRAKIPQGALKRIREVVPDLAEALEQDLNDLAPEKTEPSEPGAEREVPTPPAGLSREELREWRSQTVEELRELVKLDTQHAGWEDTIKAPAFVAWAYEGGPSQEERAQLFEFQRNDPEAHDGYLGELAKQYPNWWAEKGQYIESAKAADAGKLLNAFAATQKPAPAPKRDPKARLEQAVQPKGSGATQGKSEMTEEEAYRAAFAS